MKCRNPKCNHPLDEQCQKFPGMAVTMVTCRNKECALWDYTFSNERYPGIDLKPYYDMGEARLRRQQKK